jgi:hypothetical protein
MGNSSASGIGLFFNGKTYKFKTKVGSGSNGAAYVFSVSDKPKDSVVVKLMNRKASAATRTSTGIVCRQCCVRSTLLHNGTVEVMDHMDGDLRHYLKTTKPSIKAIAGILMVVRNQLECIDRAAGIYTDIKCENVLYRKSGNMLEVHLGDIDSIIKKPVYRPVPRSFSLPCDLEQRSFESKYNDPSLVDYLTQLLFMDMMYYFFKKKKMQPEQKVYSDLLRGTRCKQTCEMQRTTDLLKTREEYKIVYTYIDSQTFTTDTTCRHCILLSDQDPVLDTCNRSNALEKCKVTEQSNINYVFYKEHANTLETVFKTRGGTYSIKFVNRKHPIQVG